MNPQENYDIFLSQLRPTPLPASLIAQAQAAANAVQAAQAAQPIDVVQSAFIANEMRRQPWLAALQNPQQGLSEPTNPIFQNPLNVIGPMAEQFQVLPGLIQPTMSPVEHALFEQNSQMAFGTELGALNGGGNVQFDIRDILEKAEVIGETKRKAGKTLVSAWPFRNEVAPTNPPTRAASGAGVVFSWFPDEEFQSIPGCSWTYVNYAAHMVRWRALNRGKTIGSGLADDKYQQKRTLDLGNKGQPRNRMPPSYPDTYANCFDHSEVCKIDVPLMEVAVAQDIAASIAPGYPGCTMVCIEIKWHLEAFLCYVCPLEKGTSVHGHSEVHIKSEMCFDCNGLALVASSSETTGFSDETGENVDAAQKGKFEKDVKVYGPPWDPIEWR